jgi:hypothetical protein
VGLGSDYYVPSEKLYETDMTHRVDDIQPSDLDEDFESFETDADVAQRTAFEAYQASVAARTRPIEFVKLTGSGALLQKSSQAASLRGMLLKQAFTYTAQMAHASDEQFELQLTEAWQGIPTK